MLWRRTSPWLTALPSRPCAHFHPPAARLTSTRNSFGTAAPPLPLLAETYPRVRALQRLPYFAWHTGLALFRKHNHLSPPLDAPPLDVAQRSAGITLPASRLWL